MTTKKTSKTKRIAVATGILLALAVLGITTSAQAAYYGAGCNPDECHIHDGSGKIPIVFPACGPDPDALLGAGCNVQ